MGLVDMLEKAVKMGGSDIFFVPGAPVEVKVNNDMYPLTEDRLMPDSSKELHNLNCLYKAIQIYLLHFCHCRE